jgi:hypothetical protein
MVRKFKVRLASVDGGSARARRRADAVVRAGRLAA